MKFPSFQSKVILKGVITTSLIYSTLFSSFSNAKWSQIEKCFRTYLWNNGEMKTKAFTSWEIITTPKSYEGLGVYRLREMAASHLRQLVEKDVATQF